MSETVLNWLLIAEGNADLPPKEKGPSTALHKEARWSQSLPKESLVPARPPCFRKRTPRPSLQSQSFSRSYGSILPTSLTYIILSTRGCSPWRPGFLRPLFCGIPQLDPQRFDEETSFHGALIDVTHKCCTHSRPDSGTGSRLFKINMWMWCYGRTFPRQISVDEAVELRKKKGTWR